MFGLLIARSGGSWGRSPPHCADPAICGPVAVSQYVAQQQAHEATMAALCQAVETKDFYTRGHGERVSKGPL